MRVPKLIFLSIFITYLIGFSNTASFGANIVYPKSNTVTINANETFFIGSENPNKNLLINGEPVTIHQSGGFWHVVNLNPGKNIFKIDNGSVVKTYQITRNTFISTPDKNDITTLYETPIFAITKTDNVPLRSMPYDAGLNRLQHYQRGIPLKIIGEYGSFYKVQLARDDFAWISKDNVSICNTKDFSNAKILSYDYLETIDKRKFELKLSKKVPYILSESMGLDLVIYGIDNFPFDKYEFHINKIDKIFGYKSYYTSDNRLVIEVSKAQSSLKGLRVTIDAGHGGTENGAIGCLGDKEKDINLAIAQKLKEKMQQAGAIVYMTRDDDSTVSLDDRVKFTNENNSQIFISIHNNALPDSAAHLKSSGTEVYYFYPQSRELAKSVLKSITKETGLKSNFAKPQSFAVVRNTNCPAILVEIAYIINPQDNAKLLDKEFQYKAAEGILRGVENYLNDI